VELRHLRYFVAIADELSLQRWGHRLHGLQPALSQQEDELGLKLFERNSRGVPVGKARGGNEALTLRTITKNRINLQPANVQLAVL
jgi:hypothetical protein